MSKWFKSDARYVRRTDQGAGPDEAWQTYTPNISAGAGNFGGITLTSARYKRIGTIVHLLVDFTITNVGTASGNIHVPLPLPTAGSRWHSGSAREMAAVGYMGWFVASASTGYIARYDNASLIALNYRITASMTYETDPP